ncbi:MAG: 23S rRNA (uracil(1939)-C(5))-methyltransferase RlmD, partial [Clostridiales bacterium]
AQFHFFFNEDKNKRPDLGFFAESSHQAFHLEQCLLLQPVLNDFLTFLQKKLPSYGQKLVGLKDIVVQTDYLGEKIGLTLVTEKRNPIYGQLLADLSLDYPQLAFAAHNINQGGGLFGDIWPIGSDCGFLPEKIGHLSFALAPGSFLQVNSRQTLNLYNIVKRFADIQKDEKVLDIYCGIGTISLFLGEEAGEIWGIEEFAPAILAAEANASANNIKNSHFIAGKAEEILPEYQENGYYWDKIILDPPRQGCRPEVIAAICAIAPKKIVYVSCDSATLARDLKIFADKNYRVEAIQPVDMFPQTRHVECVCLLTKNK